MTKYRLTVTEPAEHDARANYEWWAENRSVEEAGRWFVGINAAMQSLKTMPERHGYADEKALRKAGYRQMGFGLGSRSTHRIIYAVQGDEVIIYRVRSGRQDALGVENITAMDD